ncbi:alpha/beta hydrolase [Schleiferilactobacillus shenzhenensis]|uniref:Dienelactone hydrolase domain-containing protein n=1 Tax=Schleiferilactobacillus shenzhenensis LY-73 TaxID=1231336 RepID=U4TTX4_9LACO|nr:alpha/beta hydrolase [Schleiferilactobacillus shenzhenensis]ERL65318.1 hypothetical protein L248_2717 [Schleiferilactobacillus shenzhenensis LY-73]
MALLGHDIIYAYQPGRADYRPVLLLHGTGGDEHDLMAIGMGLFPDSPLIGLRGRLREQGQTRYFKHTPGGGFDQQDLVAGEKWLLNSMVALMNHLQLPKTPPIVIGYSNGANIAADLMLRGGPVFSAAILLHPMVVGDPLPQRDGQPLAGVPVWLSHGRGDDIVPVPTFNGLVQAFADQGAQAFTYASDAGHQITLQEIEGARLWLDRLEQPAGPAAEGKA